MLSEDIDDINEMIGVVPECEPYRASWQRIKTALVELGTTPNKPSTKSCATCARSISHSCMLCTRESEGRVDMYEPRKTSCVG